MLLLLNLAAAFDQLNAAVSVPLRGFLLLLPPTGSGTTLVRLCFSPPEGIFAFATMRRATPGGLLEAVRVSVPLRGFLLLLRADILEAHIGLGWDGFSPPEGIFAFATG